MSMAILVWVIVALVVLGLSWVAYQIIHVLKTNTKAMTLQERIAFTYPSWISGLFDVEYDPEEIVYVLKGIPAKMIEKIVNAGIDCLNITENISQTLDEIPTGLALRGKDLHAALRLINFQTVDNQEWNDRTDIRIMSVSTADPEVRTEMFIQNYLLNLRASLTDADQKTNEKRRAFQECLAKVVKSLRDESSAELSTQEAQSSKEAWANKLYNDLQHHPDILRIDLQRKPGIVSIYTDDIVVEEVGELPRKESRAPKMYFLGKMIVEINLATGEPRYYHENNRMSSGSDHQAPHVKENGTPCLGSHSDVVAQAVRTKNYLKAFQEAIQFVKYANTDDMWGATAKTLRQLSDKEVQAIQVENLKRARKNVPTSVPQLSKSTKYILEDKKEYRKTLERLNMKYLVLDEGHNIGVSGLLITDAKKINEFVQQAISPNQTIRVDPTAQDGVRQLTFKVDEQQALFVKMMVNSWTGKELHLVDLAKLEREKNMREMREARSAYMKQLAGQFKANAQMTNEKIQQGLFSFLAKDIYRQLIALPEIDSVNVAESTIIINTNELYVKEAKLRPQAVELRCYNLDKMRIEIDLSMRNEPIRCFRINGTLPKSDGLLQAPHVDKDGVPLWGLQELRVIDSLGKLDVVAAVKETLKLLQVAKIDDARGKYVQFLPEVDILELPKLELNRKETKDKWLNERKQAEENTQLYEEIILNQTAGQNQNPA